MTDFLTADTNLPSYMMFPRFLLDMEINETAKMLYIILFDRARLSQKNEGWSDTDGHVFIYFTIEALAEVLHKSQMTVKTALAVLEKQELIFRKRQGPGHPNRIYVKIPKETLSNTDRILSSSQTENCPIDRQDSFPDTDRKLSGNKKEIKKNNLKKEGVRIHSHPMENFKMFFCRKKSLKISGRQFLTGRIILNAYPVIWLLPESNIRTMQLPSSVGQDRIILLPGKGITKVRNTKHYDKIYRKSKCYNTKQRTSA